MKTKVLIFCLIAGVYSSLHSQALITVNPATTYQTIRGFGGAGTMESGYDTYLKYVVDFMGISAFRIFMENGETSHTTITPEQINSGTYSFTYGTTYANFFKALKAKGVTTIIANTGTPPASLKKNLCMTQRAQAVEGGPYICGQPCMKPMCDNGYNSADPDNYILPEYYDEDGKFKANWVKHFEESTTQQLYGFGIQNEPLFNEPYASALLPSQTYAASLLAIKNEFTSNGLSHVKFFGPDHMGSYSRNSGGDGVGSRYIQTLLWNTTNRPLLDIYSVHSYTDGIGYDLGSAPGWTSLDTAVRVNAQKELWMTETNFGGSTDAVFFDLAYGLFSALKYGKVSAWLYWGMNGSDGMFVGGAGTPRLYSCMHFFRFIRPGYSQVESSDSDADIVSIAFKNGNDISIIVINTSSTKSKDVTINDFSNQPAYYHVYRSNSIARCAYAGKITDNTLQLAPKDVVTLYYKASEPDLIYGPSAPLNLQATQVADDKITVTWDEVADWTLAGSPIDISGYIVYIDGEKKTPDGPTTKKTWTFTGLKKNTDYKIEIYTRDAMVNQSAAAALTVRTTCSTNDCGASISDYSIDQNLSLQISPNPAMNQISVILPDENQYSLTILDLSGKSVAHFMVKNNEEIDISNLSAGLYLAIAQNEDGIFKTKFVKK